MFVYIVHPCNACTTSPRHRHFEKETTHGRKEEELLQIFEEEIFEQTRTELLPEIIEEALFEEPRFQQEEHEGPQPEGRGAPSGEAFGAGTQGRSQAHGSDNDASRRNGDDTAIPKRHQPRRGSGQRARRQPRLIGRRDDAQPHGRR
ncbi:MAG TPA: hypothetical protein VGK31_14855 [Thermoanaerobaculia bacterium]